MRRIIKKPNYKKNGFSLIEALVACAIFGIAFIGFLSLSSYGIDSTQKLIERTKASLMADQIIEEMIVNQADIKNYNEHNFKIEREKVSGPSNIIKQKQRWLDIRNKKKLAVSDEDKSSSVIKVMEAEDTQTKRKKNEVIIDINSLNGNVKVRVGRVFNSK